MTRVQKASNGLKAMGSSIQVERVVVRPGRLICDIRIAETSQRYVSAELINRVCAAYPSIPSHTCVNDVGPTFAAVMSTTSVPHLLEHLAIDIQTRASGDDAATFVGTSEWIDESRGRARIELSFKDDVEAMRAFKEALDFIG